MTSKQAEPSPGSFPGEGRRKWSSGRSMRRYSPYRQREFQSSLFSALPPTVECCFYPGPVVSGPVTFGAMAHPLGLTSSQI